MTGVLVNEGEAPVKNIGDYIQSLAQMQFLKRVDCFVEREALPEFKTPERTKVIMNGWFMRHPDRFPPSVDIDPLFISFHVTPRIETDFFRQDTVEYLKRYEPIGCRDYGTMEMMNRHGVRAYFSGCLTLTLGEKYKSARKDNAVYFVDPYYEYGAGAGGVMKHFKALFLMIKHHRKIKRFISRFKPEFFGMFQKISPALNRWAMAACFYDAYRHYFADEIIFNAEFVNHQISQADFPSNTDKFRHAEDLLRKYAMAGLVVTSRIHCALPCIGVETPVFFVSSKAIKGDSVRSGGRLDGLINLLNVLEWTSAGVKPVSERCKKVVRIDDVKTALRIGNPIDYLALNKAMVEKINAFLG